MGSGATRHSCIRVEFVDGLSSYDIFRSWLAKQTSLTQDTTRFCEPVIRMLPLASRTRDPNRPISATARAPLSPPAATPLALCPPAPARQSAAHRESTPATAAPRTPRPWTRRLPASTPASATPSGAGRAWRSGWPWQMGAVWTRGQEKGIPRRARCMPSGTGSSPAK